MHRLLTAVRPLVGKRGLQSARASVVVVLGLSRLKTRGIFQDQESNLCPLHLNYWTIREELLVVNTAQWMPL